MTNFDQKLAAKTLDLDDMERVKNVNPNCNAMQCSVMQRMWGKAMQVIQNSRGGLGRAVVSQIPKKIILAGI